MRSMRVMLQPIGEGDWQLLARLAIRLPQHLPFVECQVSPKAVPLPPGAITPRRQWLANVLLAHLVVPQGFDRIVGVTNVDLVVPPFNFVFGVAEIDGQRAVISTARLIDHNAEVTELRALKEVLHELGHTLGLPHCPDPTCVAAFSNTLADTDRKGPKFCLKCYQRLLVSWQQQCSEARQEDYNGGDRPQCR
ncbi:archaemetzincin [Candidatus Fervidibacteria bacterium JGI MDM2 JNZ-1-D12]